MHAHCVHVCVCSVYVCVCVLIVTSPLHLLFNDQVVEVLWMMAYAILYL